MIHIKTNKVYLSPQELKEIIRESLIERNVISNTTTVDDIEIGGPLFSLFDLSVTVEQKQLEGY